MGALVACKKILSPLAAAQNSNDTGAFKDRHRRCAQAAFGESSARSTPAFGLVQTICVVNEADTVVSPANRIRWRQQIAMMRGWDTGKALAVAPGVFNLLHHWQRGRPLWAPDRFAQQDAACAAAVAFPAGNHRRR